MSDIEQSIRISAVGGSEAAAQVRSVNAAFQEMGQVHDQIKSRFTESFEHVGIHLFGHDLLAAMGIASGARPILAALNVAVGETAAAFGLATGPLGLIIFGLGALAAIIYKVSEARAKHAEAISQEIKALMESSSAHSQTLSILDKYEKTYGSLSPQLQNVRMATENLIAAEARLQIIRLNEEIPALEKSVVAHQKNIDSQNVLIANMVKAVAVHRENADQLKASGQLYTYQDIAAKEGAKSIEKHRVEVAEENKVLAEGGAKLAEYRAQLAFLKTSTGAGSFLEDIKQQGEAAEKEQAKLQHVLEQEGAFLEKMHEREAALLVQTAQDTDTSFSRRLAAAENFMVKNMLLADRDFSHERQTINDNIKDETKRQQILTALEQEHASLRGAISAAGAAKEQQVWTQQVGSIGQITTNTFNAMAAGIGTSVGKMIVDGENFGKNFTKVVHDIEVMFISAVVEMMIKWAAFKALMGIGGMIFSGGASAAGANTLSNGTRIAIPGMATGGTMVATQPTLVMFGEAGAERAKFTPLSQGGAQGGDGGGSGGLTVINYIYGINNPDAFADRVGLSLLRRIRGRGDIAFARGA